MGRIAGTDAGVGCFDQQPAFHPHHSAQRRTGKEEGESERKGGKGRCREGRVEGRLPPLLPQCTAAPC